MGLVNLEIAFVVNSHGRGNSGFYGGCSAFVFVLTKLFLCASVIGPCLRKQIAQ